MTLPAPPKIIKSLNASVRPFHPRARNWVLRHQGHFPWMIGAFVFLFFLVLLYTQPEKRPNNYHEFFRDIFFIGIVGFLAGITLVQHFSMRSLRLLSEGLNYRWLTRKTVCHAYLNAPIDHLEQAIKEHRFGILFISLPFLRNALEYWLLKSPVIGTYELACLEDALLRYMSHHYPKKSHQNRLKIIKNLTPHNIDQLWLEFKTGLDQRILQDATPTVSSKCNANRRL